MNLSLLDWRRTVAASYADVRAAADPEAAWQRWITVRDGLFAHHPDTPIENVAQFAGLHYAPYDASLCFVAPVIAAPPARLDMKTSDGVVPLTRIGAAQLPFGSLDVWWVSLYGGGVFVPFADATNGQSTYGGGRYLIDTIKGADLGGDLTTGTLRLDFNFAYHPSCYYNSRWSCPLAPAGNRLPVRIDAGEVTGPGKLTSPALAQSPSRAP